MQSLCLQFYKLTHLFCSTFAYIALIPKKHGTYQLYHYSLNIQGENQNPTNLKKPYVNLENTYKWNYEDEHDSRNTVA